jgi:hypothetical protein
MIDLPLLKLDEAIGDAPVVFAVPTVRMDSIGQTTSAYAESLSTFGHNSPVVIFDNSREEPAARAINILATKCRTLRQRCAYVGPRQRRHLVEALSTSFPQAGEIIDHIFGHHYGGARNIIMFYTFGRHFISVDDDVRPHGLFLPPVPGHSDSDAIAKGAYLSSEEAAKVSIREQDVFGSVTQLLGRRVGATGLASGLDIRDSNAPVPFRDCLKISGRHELSVDPGPIHPDAVINIVQTHLTGDADIEVDALLNAYFDTRDQRILFGFVPKKLCLSLCRGAVTMNNSRLTGAVLAYDNSTGGMYFLPTKLRCEDYIWRLAIRYDGSHACALAATSQTHYRASTGRDSLASEWFNEQVAWSVATNMFKSVDNLTSRSVRFDLSSIDVGDEAAEIGARLNDLCGRFQQLTRATAADQKTGADFSRIQDACGAAASGGELCARLHDRVRDEMKLYNRIAEIWPRIMEFAAETVGEMPIHLLN